jgi:hypothetical protein
MLEAGVALRVRDALFSQRYNLLLGAGCSLDSTDRTSKKLIGSDELRRQLCEVTGSRPDSPLWRVAGLLTPEQIKQHLTEQFLGCRAGPTLKAFTRFTWRQVFTLNIDDALENAYESASARLQQIVPVNYNREYETFRNPAELPAIHLHGFVRSPADKYVFSLQEYAAAQAGMNPWVHVLSQLIISEPFIIAGTALFEPDLEYFLAHRPSNSQVLARAPSILVEPSPDAGTRRDCARLNLILVEGKLSEFLDWLQAEFGPAPTPLTNLLPKVGPRTITSASTLARTAFWSDFDFVPDSIQLLGEAARTSAFTFGRPPSWEDIAASRDVPLQSQLPVIDEIRRWQSSTEAGEFVCLEGLAGSGVSTSVRRVAADLAKHGLQVIYLKARRNFDLDSALEALEAMADPLVLVTDSFAEHGDQLVDLYTELVGSGKRLLVLGGERKYRMRLVREILSEQPAKYLITGDWRVEERIQLIRRYSDLGLIGNAEAYSDPRKFAAAIDGNTVAEAICRVLNDFRPLKTIVRSLWNDTVSGGRPAYLAVSIAYYCHPVGVRREVIAGLDTNGLIADLSQEDAPLRVVPDPDDAEFLIPANPTLASLLVQEMARAQPERLLRAVVDLANAIEPLVTRHTIKQRTAEARLAGRLFDADGLMPDLLHDRFDKFLDLTHERWRWNSRYWEQRAMWIGSKDRALAVQYARHAVSIERHPFPLTTLAQMLFGASAEAQPRDAYAFNEAVDLVEEAMGIESRWERGITRASYRALVNGVLEFVEHGGQVSQKRMDFIRKALAKYSGHFINDDDLTERAQRVIAALSNKPAEGAAD